MYVVPWSMSYTTSDYEVVRKSQRYYNIQLQLHNMTPQAWRRQKSLVAMHRANTSKLSDAFKGY